MSRERERERYRCAFGSGKSERQKRWCFDVCVEAPLFMSDREGKRETEKKREIVNKGEYEVREREGEA